MYISSHKNYEKEKEKKRGAGRRKWEGKEMKRKQFRLLFVTHGACINWYKCSLRSWLQIKTILRNSNILCNCLYQFLKLWNSSFYLNTSLHYAAWTIFFLYDTVRRQVSVLERDKACTATLTYSYSTRREFYRMIKLYYRILG